MIEQSFNKSLIKMRKLMPMMLVDITQNALSAVLIQLWQRTGTTVIFITHNIEEAVYLSERILVLTNKPTSVKTVLDNPLPLPRDVVSEEFVALRNKVTDLIRWW